MATMTSCKDCGQQVSRKAETCPGCGRARPGGGMSSTAVLVTVIVGLVILVAIAAAAMNSAEGL